MKKPRFCRRAPGFTLYKPAGLPLREMEIVEIALDELETLRLCDLEGHDQEAAAEQMGISRGTVQRLLQAGRRKLVDAVTHGKALALADSKHVVFRGGPHRHGHGGPHHR